LVERISQNEGAIRYRVILPATSPVRETLASGLIAGGVNLREISEDKFGLEDIFLAATRRSPAEKRRP
jgi:hypothetical protein